MKQPHTKTAKKSETLEVRLSHPDKLALQDKAAREGRTVSDVVRGLISSYLVQSETRSKPSHLTELLMTLKSRPKSVFATLAILPLLAAPFFLPTAANAGDIALTLESEYSEPEESHGAYGKRVRRVKTEIEIDENQFFSLPVASGHQDNASMHMSLRVSEGLDQIVIIEITICEKIGTPTNLNDPGQLLLADSCDGERLIAKPKISAKYGETAEFRFEVEHPMGHSKNRNTADFQFSDDNRKVFKLMASPKRI